MAVSNETAIRMAEAQLLSPKDAPECECIPARDCGECDPGCECIPMELGRCCDPEWGFDPDRRRDEERNGDWDE